MGHLSFKKCPRVAESRGTQPRLAGGTRLGDRVPAALRGLRVVGYGAHSFLEALVQCVDERRGPLIDQYARIHLIHDVTETDLRVRIGKAK
jgi:hypothetical protein